MYVCVYLIVRLTTNTVQQVPPEYGGTLQGFDPAWYLRQEVEDRAQVANNPLMLYTEDSGGAEEDPAVATGGGGGGGGEAPILDS
jgi:hypothetical protein